MQICIHSILSIVKESSREAEPLLKSPGRITAVSQEPPLVLRWFATIKYAFKKGKWRRKRKKELGKKGKEREGRETDVFIVEYPSQGTRLR